jgi:YhcH/YjgK/YiaL family protein
MILDDLKNSQLYAQVYEGFDKAFTFLENCKKNAPQIGKHIIDSEYVYADVQEYETFPKDELLWEAHRRYIDIQYILSGNESIGWSNSNYIPDDISYNDQKDCIVFTDTQVSSYLNLQEDQFAIFFPGDAHKPKCQNIGKSKVKKIVVKVAVK